MIYMVTEERRAEIVQRLGEIRQLLAYRQKDEAKELTDEMDALNRELES